MGTTAINTYYKRIINLILELHNDDLNNATNGHCMKITGLGLNELEFLWDQLSELHSHINTFIISDAVLDKQRYISATKLIELRNQQDAPLLVLIPSNSRTAAEDSYGNATFKEISLDDIELRLKEKLINEIPVNLKGIIKEDILNYLKSTELDSSNIIRYLIELQDNNFSNEAVGNYLYLLDLIPDKKLIKSVEKTRSRLNFNIESVNLLTAFSKPLYERISDLPLEPNTLQKSLVELLKKEIGAKNKSELTKLIFEKYTNLNFSNWEIPDLDFKHIQLFVKELSSKGFQTIDGRKVLSAEIGKSVKLKIRFQTNPPPKDITNLKYFKIILMAVDGENGEEINVLRKLKNTNSLRPYRDATIELNSNHIEEGAYFLKVLAEDEHGSVLNADDDFQDSLVQKTWEEEKTNNSNSSKSSFPYKLTCDSEDLDYIVDEAIEQPENLRKGKLNNVTQAYFKYRIEKLKSGEETLIPEASENSNVWINDEKTRPTSTFHIQFSERHNYQINLSSKLRSIENEFLKNGKSFGSIRAQLKNNSAVLGFETLDFVPSELTSMIPNPILKLREEIFTRILESNENKDGVFETADIYNFTDKIKSYLSKYSKWINKLKANISNNELDSAEKSKLQPFLTEIQFFDIAKIKTKLPDGRPTVALLLSPLHPLRLVWLLELIGVYNDWEKKTQEFSGYKDDWSKNLELLFEGQVSPENNPLVIVEPTSFDCYHYSGELAYGWGLYLNSLNDDSKEGMTSVSRQIKHYFRQLFNITKDNYVETDISQKLIVRHIKNYLAQHPYTEKLTLNLINAGDASVFTDAFVELEKEKAYQSINYEVRIFKGQDKIIEHGESLKNLINPESNISEEAEAFSQPSKNRLFPKLRFSINNISDYLKLPSKYTAHISFLISPFPITVELIKPLESNRNFYLNGLISDSTVSVEDDGNEIKWNRYIQGNKLPIKYDGTGKLGVELFDSLQSFIAGSLASKYTESLPSTQLRLNDRDKVLLTHIHDFSDWVITFDKNLGPQIFDQPSKDGKIPFLLDYVPGEEILGVSSYLTTRPTSEVLGLLGPHFEDFDLDIHKEEDEKKIKILLEDLRAVSSSLVLQLNSSKNKAFEVIGSAFTKRVLEKKGYLVDSFLIPIDLHQNLFKNLATESKSRADNLLVSIDPTKKEIAITIIEIKCRTYLGTSEKEELKIKMKEQVENTIEALRNHFDSSYNLSFDRLDREIKNKELKSLLSFYIERAFRYNYLSDNAFAAYNAFLQHLDSGFKLKFNKLGLIFNFSASIKHQKEIDDDSTTFFTFGKKLIQEILDPDSDLNTIRLEDVKSDDEFKKDLGLALGSKEDLKPFIKKFKPKNEEIQPEVKKKPELKKKSIIKESSIQSKVEKEIKTEDNKKVTVKSKQHISPDFDILIGNSSPTKQYGILGETVQGKKIAMDLSVTNTISLFGVQGGGKSYTIGTISEMVLKQMSKINNLPSPLAGVIFHYSESMDYEPEFTSMIYANDKESEIQKLKERYGADPNNIEDVILLTPKDKVEERKQEFPSIQVKPIAFNSKELSVKDWMFLLGAIGNDSTYIKQLKAIMKEHRKNITLEDLTDSVENSVLLSNSQKALARQKLSFAREYVDDNFTLQDLLKPERLIIVDLRDEFIVKEEALGLFVIMLNIFSSVKNVNGKHFNKFIVFDEAHKYMDNKDLTGNIVTAIREMRHKGVSIMIASQDPPSLPNEIIELSSIVLLHKFNSPQWLKHIQKSITQLGILNSSDMSALTPGEGFIWATKATDKSISAKPVKISTRPRATRHGGGTIQATDK